MRDVVAVPHVREDLPAQGAQTLADRHQIRERLAGMLEVGQRVDHRHGGSLGERLQTFLLEGPKDDPVNVA